MVMAMAFALFGAYIGRYATSTHLEQMKTHKMSLTLSVGKGDVATSKISKLNFIEMTNDKINAVFRCSGLISVQQLHF